MAVKIEVLDYTFGQVRGNEMLANSEFSTSTDWTTGGSWTISGGKASHGTNQSSFDYLQYTNVTFEQGKTYQLKMPIANVTQGTIYLANHLAGANSLSNNQTGNNFITWQWVQAIVTGKH